MAMPKNDKAMKTGVSCQRLFLKRNIDSWDVYFLQSRFVLATWILESCEPC